MRKPTKRTRAKARRKESTGTDERFFLGGDWVLEGFMHVKPPRWSPAYEKMTVAEICRRVWEDIEELVARSYPTYQEEWAKKFAPKWWRECGVPHDKRCHHIDEKFANRLRRGLWESINSKNRTVAARANKELTELLKKHDETEPKHAANALAQIAREATARLENLSVKRVALMQEIAKEFKSWPVNLGVGLKQGRGKTVSTITGGDFAREYLLKLGVNSAGRPSDQNGGGSRLKSPFRVAAERLYQDLEMMRREPKFCFKRVTPWARRLLALSAPMTTANRDDWWEVAKIWVDAQWESNVESFDALIKHLGFDLDRHTRSLVKKRVIDDSLKKAFKGLAVPAE